MSDEFLTKGLQSDRYLKAIRLAEQFETEMLAKLRQVGERMVSENRSLFDAGVGGEREY